MVKFDLASQAIDDTKVLLASTIAAIRETHQVASKYEPIYFDVSAGKVTTSNAGPNKLVGVAIRAAGSGDSTGRVRLNESFG